MHGWHTEYDFGTESRKHTIARGTGSALLAPLAAYAFNLLRVSAAVWEHGAEWWPIHTEPNVIVFEVEHGRDRERGAHNVKKLGEAARTKRLVRAEHAGLSDVFAPIVIRGRTVGVLAAGPFSTKRPASVDVLERWKFLTGRQGHPSDPEFEAYLSATLSTLVLERTSSAAFEELVQCFALLMAGNDAAADLMNRIEILQHQLEEIRLPERMWDAVRNMVDERTERSATSLSTANQRRLLGVSRPTDQVIVGLTRPRTKAEDPVDEVIRRDRFQRAAVELVRDKGEALCGQVGTHGIVVMSGAAKRPRSRALALSDSLAALAVRFGFSLHLGICSAERDVPLGRSYQRALAAAESALSDKRKVVVAEPAGARTVQPLRALRSRLSAGPDTDPDSLAPRFEQYLEAVAISTGHRIDSVRTHLEVGFDQITDALQSAGIVDAKSVAFLSDQVERAADAARTIDELLASYRLAIADLTAAAKAPAVAAHDRGLRAAVEYMHRHYAEPLREARVARVAGLSPKYFSSLFRQREGTTFEAALRALRLSRAESLLRDTDLSVERIARLSGFGSAQYLCRVFRRSSGKTPLEYRNRSRGAARAPRNRTI